IALHSAPGLGSTFAFTFRLTLGTPPQLQTAPPKKEAAIESARGLRVLVADDDLINRMVTLAQVKQLGWKADAVTNGKEAVSALESLAYDLVLMDCQMPEMDGYQATQAIRARGSGPNRSVPIIALTASALEDDHRRCLATGMTDCITKPVSRENLQRV